MLEFLSLLQQLDGKNMGYVLFAVFFFVMGKIRLSQFASLLTTIVMSGFLLVFAYKGIRWTVRQGYWATVFGVRQGKTAATFGLWAVGVDYYPEPQQKRVAA